MGRKIKVLTDAAYQPGFHSINWDGRDESNSLVATGLYFYELRTDKKGSGEKNECIPLVE